MAAPKFLQFYKRKKNLLTSFFGHHSNYSANYYTPEALGDTRTESMSISSSASHPLFVGSRSVHLFSPIARLPFLNIFLIKSHRNLIRFTKNTTLAYARAS